MSTERVPESTGSPCRVTSVHMRLHKTSRKFKVASTGKLGSEPSVRGVLRWRDSNVVARSYTAGEIGRA